MARPLRLEFPGELYHVTSRGNQRENIFDDNDDRRQFLLVLQGVCRRYNWICHAYCLMSNHYYLLMRLQMTIILDCNAQLSTSALSGCQLNG
jgi:putative transposase